MLLPPTRLPSAYRDTSTDATGRENRNDMLCQFTGENACALSGLSWNSGLGHLEAVLAAIANEPWRDWNGKTLIPVVLLELKAPFDIIKQCVSQTSCKDWELEILWSVPDRGGYGEKSSVSHQGVLMRVAAEYPIYIYMKLGSSVNLKGGIISRSLLYLHSGPIMRCS